MINTPEFWRYLEDKMKIFNKKISGGKLWYKLGQYGGFVGIVYSAISGDHELFAISAVASLYGSQGLENMKTNERISQLEKEVN